MVGAWLSGADPWAVYPLGLTAIIAAGVAGRWLGRQVARRGGGDGSDHLSGVQGALIGLLSLMIGFTFSLSLSRFEARKAAVLNEAIAIGTAEERATLLPPAQAASSRRLLDAYVETRIALGGAGLRPAGQRQALVASQRLRRALLAQAQAALSADPRSGPTVLFVLALNELGDRHEARIAADHNQVPAAAFLTLYGLAMVAWGFVGYAGGVNGARNAVSAAVLAAAFVTVITLVADLDRPESGMVTVGQRPLLDLRARADAAPAL
ncbi:MAG: hypothetical protein ACR2FH_10185 [Caulobacteraceae bacterium]